MAEVVTLDAFRNKTSDHFAPGDATFRVEGTFRVDDHIYVLTDHADQEIRTVLQSLGYLPSEENVSPQLVKFVHPRKPPPEMFKPKDFVQPGELELDYTLKDKPKYTLTDPKIHEVIVGFANQRKELDYYNRKGDTMQHDVPLTRMTAFVKNMVDVDLALWEQFLADTAHERDHAKDFLRRLAHWGGAHSDRSKRRVRGGQFSADEIIDTGKPFTPKEKRAGMYFVSGREPSEIT